MTEADGDDCRVDLTEELTKSVARSVLFVQSGRTTADDLCKIFLKQFHKALGFP